MSSNELKRYYERLGIDQDNEEVEVGDYHIDDKVVSSEMSIVGPKLEAMHLGELPVFKVGFLESHALASNSTERR